MATGDGDLGASDGELAARVIASGDRQAEAMLCARFAPRVRAYGLRHLQDASAADDLVQRVLVLMLEKLRRREVREPARIASFVLGSARLCSGDMRRKAARLESLDANHAATARLAQGPAEPIDRQQLVVHLEQLPERERSVLVMAFFEGASAAEIGATLGIAAGHVRVVRHRALARLRARMLTAKEGQA